MLSLVQHNAFTAYIVFFLAGIILPPTVDPDFVNSPDNDTPPGEVPPLLRPFIQAAGVRRNSAVATFSGCGSRAEGCCVSLFGFAATGTCLGGSACRTGLIFPVCDTALAGGCAASGGAAVGSACTTAF